MGRAAVWDRTTEYLGCTAQHRTALHSRGALVWEGAPKFGRHREKCGFKDGDGHSPSRAHNGSRTLPRTCCLRDDAPIAASSAFSPFEHPVRPKIGTNAHASVSSATQPDWSLVAAVQASLGGGENEKLHRPGPISWPDLSWDISLQPTAQVYVTLGTVEGRRW